MPGRFDEGVGHGDGRCPQGFTSCGSNEIGKLFVCSNVIMEPRVDRRGSDSAFEALYRAELVGLRALGTSLSGSPEVGADLAHEALLRAYRDWPTVGGLERPGAWVRRVLINLATDHHRRRGREREVLSRIVVLNREDAVAAVDGAFWTAVRALPTRQRSAIALRYIDDMSVDEIAEVLNVGAGTVKRALSVARQTLARTLCVEEVDDANAR